MWALRGITQLRHSALQLTGALAADGSQLSSSPLLTSAKGAALPKAVPALSPGAVHLQRPVGPKGLSLPNAGQLQRSFWPIQLPVLPVRVAPINLQSVYPVSSCFLEPGLTTVWKDRC